MTDLSEKLEAWKRDSELCRIKAVLPEETTRILALIDALEHARNVARAHGVTSLDAEAFDAEILRCLEGK